MDSTIPFLWIACGTASPYKDYDCSIFRSLLAFKNAVRRPRSAMSGIAYASYCSMPSIAISAIYILFSRLCLYHCARWDPSWILQAICVLESCSDTINRGLSTSNRYCLVSAAPKYPWPWKSLIFASSHLMLCELLTTKYQNVYYDALTHVSFAMFTTESAVAYPEAKTVLDRKKV